MGFRESLGLNAAPLLLRLGLGVVFLWAGGSKILYRNQYTGAEAAILANLGIVTPAAPGAPVTPVEPAKPEATPEPVPSSPAKPAESAPSDVKPSETKPADAPIEPKREASPPSARGALTSGMLVLAQVPAGGAVDPAAPSKDAGRPTPGVALHSGQRLYTADDFPAPVTVTRLYSLAILLHTAAQPDEQGRRLWPERLAAPRTIKVMCWMAALTEFLGGALVLVGFLTRVWGLALAGTMATAMLLTTVGPSALSGSGFLGFLPQPMLDDQARWVGAWTTFLFQFVLLLVGLSLALIGPGALSIDRLLFRPGGQRGSSDSKE